jgi:DNA-binding winged helix-turn-helix (wHTH) protein
LDTVSHQENTALYRFGKFTLDMPEQRLLHGNESIQLTKKQFDLLHYFVLNAGKVAKKADILDAVWPATYVEETTLARNVSWLRKRLETDGGEPLIETVPKIGYRFTPDVGTISAQDLFVVEEQSVHYFRAEETITQTPPAPRQFSRILAGVLAGIVCTLLAVGGYSIFRGMSADGSQTLNSKLPQEKPVGVPTSNSIPIKIGSIVHLRSDSTTDSSFLDAWGAVYSKREFQQVPTEKMFVSTHSDPNRNSGSGSWEIVSASGKAKGEMLAVGDRIHLRNMYPGAGFLDTCGWVEHLRVFDDYADQSAGVFTTKSSDRDNGSGTWTVRSTSQANGNPVSEDDRIALESNLNIDDTGKVHIAGFLNVTGNVKEILAFSDHNGSRLVFTKSNPHGQAVPDIWTIMISKAFPN